MSSLHEDAFLQAIREAPEDDTPRLVYADWLEERADPRAEYLRLEARAREVLPGRADLPGLRRRVRELGAQLPPWWVAIAGGLYATPADSRPTRVEEVAHALSSPEQYTDEEGYEVSMHAAARRALRDAAA